MIGTGGRLVLQNQNWSKLQTKLVRYLKVNLEVIYERVRSNANHPLLCNNNPLGTIRQLIEEKRGWYEQVDMIMEVKADMDMGDAADACVHSLHDFIDNNPLHGRRPTQRHVRMDWIGCN